MSFIFGKRLLVFETNVNNLNGISISLNQDKRYLIHFELYNYVSESMGICANNDTSTSNYRQAYMYTEGQVDDTYARYLVWLGSDVYRGKFCYWVFPKLQLSRGEENLIYHSGSTWRYRPINRTVYYSSQINTLDIIAPNDDVECFLKIYEVEV